MSECAIRHAGKASGGDEYGDNQSNGEYTSGNAPISTAAKAYSDASCYRDTEAFADSYQNCATYFNTYSHCSCAYFDPCSFTIGQCFTARLSLLLYVVHTLDMV